MEVIHPRCAGLDVHKKTVVACVSIVGDGPPLQEVRTFATTTSGLLALADWLDSFGIGVVAMECWRRPKIDPLVRVVPTRGDARAPRVHMLGADLAALQTEVDHWQHTRNATRQTIEWKFTRQDADRKLGRHYVPLLTG